MKYLTEAPILADIDGIAKKLAPGCENSPDAWVEQYVLCKPSPHSMDRAIRVVVYYADGRRRLTEWRGGSFVMDVGPREWKPNRSFLPLQRNAVMVHDFVVTHSDGIVHAFRAPWSKTGGTRRTIEHARQAKLRIVSHDCPTEYGPL